ncbi:MAG TPA: Wzz/FepE/Etk N-terminal domain-containing protein [Thermoleophilaceae bacterium]|nr:Wzz/FepE/Etk N-terminal domain-containing protein [Thermoleophilaceae bacterium]
MATDAQSTPSATQDLLGHIRALRRRWKLIIGFTLIVVVAAVVLSISQTKEYEAISKVVLSPTERASALFNPDVDTRSADPERDINTQVQLITFETVAERVRERLGLDDISTDDLLEKVKTEVEGNSNIVSILARDPEPEQAAGIATSFAEEYAAFREESARENLNAAAETARERLDQLSEEELLSPEGRELQAQVRTIEITAAATDGGVEVARRAGVPDNAASPKPVRTGILALVLGLFLALALALLLDVVDRRLKEEQDIESAFGLPILASIPRPARRSATTIPGADRVQYEGYSALATNLRFYELGSGLEALMFTSPSPGEGKTSVTLGTARALAALDLRVIAIEADLRRPTFSIYGLSRGRGLSTTLAGVSDLEQALVEVGADSFEPVDGKPTRGRTFHVLPAGPAPPNPQALLARPAMTDIIEEARSLADVVLLDCPPIGTVNDPVTLAALVDGVVLVARLNQTTRDAARRTMRTLENLEAQLVGIVVTGGAPGEAYYGATAYGGAASRAHAV